jgi:hypothetical protein
MLREFENRALRGIFEPKRDELTGNRRSFLMRIAIICTSVSG